ncbi:MAG: hypothetical protein ABIM89_17535 [Mycobacteriales bacterium]
MNRLTATLVIGGLASVGVLALSVPASAACAPAALPDTALRHIADGVAVNGKTVGAGWESVALGTVTEVRHKTVKHRYRITMRIDSTLGAELPPIYTFFGSSRGTFPFEVGKVYAVGLSQRTRAPLTPATELWAEPCDVVIAVPDLSAAHEVIASTQPGYQPPAPPAPAKPEVEVATVTEKPPVALPPRQAAAQRSAVHLPEEGALKDLIKLGVLSVALLGVAIALVAAAESRWSRRHYA